MCYWFLASFKDCMNILDIEFKVTTVLLSENDDVKEIPKKDDDSDSGLDRLSEDSGDEDEDKDFLPLE